MMSLLAPKYKYLISYMGCGCHPEVVSIPPYCSVDISSQRGLGGSLKTEIAPCTSQDASNQC